MHALCIGCHAKSRKENKPEVARCAECHRGIRIFPRRRTCFSAGGHRQGAGGAAACGLEIMDGVPGKEFANHLGRSLFELVPFNVSVIDREFRVLAANRNFEEFFGDWQGMHCYQAYKNSSERCLRCQAKAAFEDGQVHVSDETGVDRNGRKCHYVVHLAPLKGDDGEVKYLIEMTSDLTETRRWQREYDLFFERVPCYVMVLDPNFRVVRANEKFRQAFGDAEGKFCYEVCKRRKLRVRIVRPLSAFKDGAEHISGQVGVHRDGSPAYYVVTASALFPRRTRRRARHRNGDRHHPGPPTRNELKSARLLRKPGP